MQGLQSRHHDVILGADVYERWVARDEEELSECIKARRPGRPAHPKQLKLQQQIEKDREEFRTGFLVPDMQDFANVERLKRWDGTTGGLAQVNFTRVTRDPLPKKDEDAMEE